MPELTQISSVYRMEKQLNPVEMLRAIKLAIASEFEAIQIYQQIMESTDDKRVIRVLAEITDDEKKHAGGLYQLLELLAPADAEVYAQGAEETLENYK